MIKPVGEICLNTCRREYVLQLVLTLAAQEVLGQAVAGRGLGTVKPVALSLRFDAWSNRNEALHQERASVVTDRARKCEGIDCLKIAFVLLRIPTRLLLMFIILNTVRTSGRCSRR